MRVRMSGRPLWGAARLAAAALFVAVIGSQAARAQYIFAPYSLVEDFEAPADTDKYVGTGDAIFVDPTAVNHAVGTTHGVTRGTRAMQVETEGAFALNDGEDFFGWGAIGGLAVIGDYTSGPGYTALQTAAADPDKWVLVFDVSSDADSWLEAPDTATSTAVPNDVGPDRSGSRVQVSYDGQAGTPFNTGSIWGTTGKLTVKVPFKALYDSITPAPLTGATQWQIAFGADNNRFAPDDPAPNGGAKHYIDNIRLKPATPQVPDVLFDFEGGGVGAFDGWSDLGRTGTDTNHKHSIVTGANIGATKYNSLTGKFDPDAAGQGMLIDTSNIAPGANGFQWGSSRAYDADTNNDGTVDAPAVKTELTSLIAKMRKATAIQVDVTYHDATAVPTGLSSPVQGPQGGGTVPFVAGETNGPWLKLVLGVELDSTPIDGKAAGLVGNQYDNEFATDANGNNIQTSRGDYATTLTTEIQPGDDVSPEEPVTFTYGMSQIGSLVSALQQYGDTTNFLRFTFAVQTGTGDSTLLAVIDNFRLVTAVSLDGDYDHDGDVDGADLAPWKTALGGTAAGSDGDENGLVDGADILLHQRNVGNDATPALAVSGAVPEPGSVVLLGLGALAFGAARRRS